MSEPQPEPIKPESATFQFCQENDSCDTYKYGQTLNVETCDAGGGPYLRIKTTGWAIEPDDIDKLADTLRWCLSQVKGWGDESEDRAEDQTEAIHPESGEPT